MEAQKRTLKQIIDTNGADLITDVNPKWFTDNINLELLNSIIEVAKTSESIDEESIKTHIQMNGYKPLIKKMILGRLNDIIRAEYQPTSDVLERLENEYKNNKLRSLTAHLMDKDATLKSRTEKLGQIYNELTNQNEAKKIHNMNSEVMQYTDDIEKGIPDRFNEKSITLKDKTLIHMFGSNKIYPIAYVLGGRPSFRKTDIIINIMIELESLGLTGMVFTFEDVKETWRSKYLAIKNKIPKTKILEMNIDKYELEKIKKTTGSKNDNKIFFYDKPLHLSDFIRIVAQQMKMRDYQYILVDYLQKFLLNSKRDIRLEMNDISGAIHRMTNEYLIPMICTSQVGKRNESYEGEVNLTLGDFKESGSIEQDFKWAGMIGGFRDSPDKTINIVKNTWGSLGRLDVQFDPRSGYLESWSPYGQKD